MHAGRFRGIWWRFGLVWTHFPHKWSFVWTFDRLRVVSPHKGPDIWSFDCLCVVGLNKLLNKHSHSNVHKYIQLSFLCKHLTLKWYCFSKTIRKLRVRYSDSLRWCFLWKEWSYTCNREWFDCWTKQEEKYLKALILYYWLWMECGEGDGIKLKLIYNQQHYNSRGVNCRSYVLYFVAH